MNLHAMLRARSAAGRPVTVGLIGAGKFGTMFLAQVRRTPGMHLVALAGNARHIAARDLSDGAERRARLPCRRRGHLQGSRVRVGQQHRFPDRREMPADRLEPAGPRAGRLHHRKLRHPRALPVDPPTASIRGLALPARLCFAGGEIGGSPP